MKTTSLQVRLHTVANLPIALEFVQVLILEIKHSPFSIFFPYVLVLTLQINFS